MSDIEEGRVERLVAGGAGLLRREGPVCFVRGVLPGERIRYRVTGKRRGVFTGELLEVLEASSARVSPPCPYYAECGGCEIEEIAYPEQLRLKREILIEQLERIGGFREAEVGETRGGAAYGYRTRVRLHRNRRGEYGFRRRRSREIVPVRECIVATAAINRELPRLVGEEPEAEEIVLAEHDHGVVRSLRPEAVSVTLLGSPVRFSGAGFFQSNLSMFETLLQELLSLAEKRFAPGSDHLPATHRPGAAGGLRGATASAGEGYILYDLYAGSGAIASVVARGLRDAVGVIPEEIHCVEPDAASAMFVAENLAAFPVTLDRIALESYVLRHEPPGRESLVIVDPPRAGLSEEVRSWLLSGRPRQLFYVSCDPATLARDLGSLAEGYVLEKVIPFDFFPQTSHIETLCLLTPKGTP